MTGAENMERGMKRDGQIPIPKKTVLWKINNNNTFKTKVSY